MVDKHCRAKHARPDCRNGIGCEIPWKLHSTSGLGQSARRAKGRQASSGARSGSKSYSEVGY